MWMGQNTMEKYSLMLELNMQAIKILVLLFMRQEHKVLAWHQ